MTIAKPLGWMLIVLACGATPLTAAAPDPASPVRYGIRILAASPRQDFRNLGSRSGFGGGLFAETDVGSGWIAQTRFDYLSYPQNNQPGAGAIATYTTANPITLSADSASLGVDLRHPVPGLPRLCGLAGVTAIRYEFQSSSVTTQVNQNGIPIPGIIRYKDKTPVKLGLAVGISFELWQGLVLAERYTSADINGTTFGTLETSLSYRF
jgi:hypothetical protein